MSDFFDGEDDDRNEDYDFELPENSSEFFIYGIIPSDRSLDAYNLILKDRGNSSKMVSITIGGAEAQSIAIFLESQNDERLKARPFSHDLFTALIDQLDVRLLYVIIDGVDFEKTGLDTVYSSMVFRFSDDQIVLDSRPSDAISISLRADAPIFITNDVMNNLGITTKDAKPKEEEQVAKEPEKIKSINEMLDEAIANEDYEKAAHLRDKIKNSEESKNAEKKNRDNS